MVGQRVQAPAHGHNPLEIMTQQDYSSKVLAAPTGNLLVGNDNTPPPSISFNTRDAGDAEEIAKFTEEGFYYKGEFIDDAGEVHRLLREVLNGITYKQLCIELLEWLDHYNNCCNTDIGIEEYGKSLSMTDRARAALNP